MWPRMWWLRGRRTAWKCRSPTRSVQRIRDLGLRKPIYRKTAAYGHFGRDDVEFPWKKTDKAAALKKAAGL